MVVAVGETVIVRLFPSGREPHDPEYQNHEAPDPKEPPDPASIEFPPVQIDDCEPVILVAVVEM